MSGLLLANAAATLFMVGLTWFVQVVHYPLFPFVGAAEFSEYHRVHSTRTTWVVLPPMLVELLTSIALVFDPPEGETGLVVAGAALAAATWLLTAVGAAPMHGRIGRDGLRPSLLKRLLAISWIRTLVWTAHGIVVLLLLEAAVGGGG